MKMAGFSLRQISKKKTKDSEAEENEEHSSSSETPSRSTKQPSSLSRQSKSSLLTPVEAVKAYSFAVTGSSTARITSSVATNLGVPSYLVVSRKFDFFGSF
jgi:hypothetical protein